MFKNFLQVMLLQCIANMSVSTENAQILKETVTLIIKRLDSNLDMERTVAFQALTNLTYNIAPSQINDFLPAVPVCLKRYFFAVMLPQMCMCIFNVNSTSQKEMADLFKCCRMNKFFNNVYHFTVTFYGAGYGTKVSRTSTRCAC